MASEGNQLPHKVTLDERKRLTLTGATEVIRFSDELVELTTSQGSAIIQGSDLKLKCLSLDDGTVVIQGWINGIYYEDPRPRRGLFR